ncbi:hypothetical protein IMSHALPRED_006247 [Imshaugia aleurites]|uniref:Heme haloperoxidase family profile domain-containing protein n=1 Tax=Imshaugia aleurites TaxID=172621 RepID=A0A8H3IMN7_9LECA|nr:hypothetical protein IMSHALPRED_006247 [Imshaugia aleurites]
MISKLPVVLFALSAIQITAFPRLDAYGVKELTSLAKNSGECPHLSKKDKAECPHLAKNKELKRQTTFDPTAQRVSTSGDYDWVAPGSGDQRGPCPGLNALANHGYLPHNGVADIPTIVSAVNTAYGMGIDLGTFLAVYGSLFDGDAVSLDPGYSIGGPATSEDILGLGVLGTPSGLSGSHNNYEADTSATRGDLYVVGNDYLLQAAPEQYAALFPFRQTQFNNSIATNPYFFYPQFAGVFVSPAGYAFPPRMMANHSAEYPSGYLDKASLMSFFAVTGESGAFNYTPGWERIPDNFYRRPLSDPYTIPAFILDVLAFGILDPRLLSIGGNTGTTDSFTGLDVSDLTGGVFDGATLAQGNNLECFIFQLVQAESPTMVAGLYGNVTAAMQPLAESISSNLAGLGCPQLGAVSSDMYDVYPGYTMAKGV